MSQPIPSQWFNCFYDLIFHLIKFLHEPFVSLIKFLLNYLILSNSIFDLFLKNIDTLFVSILSSFVTFFFPFLFTSPALFLSSKSISLWPSLCLFFLCHLFLSAIYPSNMLFLPSLVPIHISLTCFFHHHYYALLLNYFICIFVFLSMYEIWEVVCS